MKPGSISYKPHYLILQNAAPPENKISLCSLRYTAYHPTSFPFSSLSVHQKPLLSERDVSSVAAMPLRSATIASPPFISPTPLPHSFLFASTLFPLLESLTLSSLSSPSCFIRLSYFYILQLLMLLLCSSFPPPTIF
jgi:hypothetical protein